MSFAYPGVYRELDNVLQRTLYSRTMIEFYRSIYGKIYMGAYIFRRLNMIFFYMASFIL